jgi:prepilin peptidase CpaA
MSPSLFATAVSAACLMVLLVAAFVDVRDRIIPNGLVMLTLGGGLVVRLLSDPWMIWLSLIISFGAFVALAYVTRHKFIGGGDAKMIAAVTLLVAPDRVLPLLLDVALAGGVVAFVYLVARFGLTRYPPSLAPSLAPSLVYASNPGGRAGGLCSMLRAERARIVGGEPMPYGVAIAAGVACRLLLDAVR